MQAWAAALLRWLFRIEVIVACTAFVVVAAALFADVVAREMFGNGLFGAQKLAVFCTAVAGLLGFTIVVQTGGHLRIGAVDRLFPDSWQPAMMRLADLLSCILCAALGYYAVEFVMNSRAMRETDMVFRIPVWPVQAVLPYIFLASALRYLCFALFPALRPEEKESG